MECAERKIPNSLAATPVARDVLETISTTIRVDTERHGWGARSGQPHFGAIGYSQVSRNEGEGGGKGMAIAGMICGGVGCVIAVMYNAKNLF